MGSVSTPTLSSTTSEVSLPSTNKTTADSGKSLLKSNKIIDLTHPLIAGKTPFCEGHPCYTCQPNLSLLETTGITVHSLTLGTHTGTHIDAPYHFVQSKGQKVDEIELSWLVNAEAIVADVRGKAPKEPITWDDIYPQIKSHFSVSSPTNPQIIIILTGYFSFYGTPKYASHPYLSPTAARELLDLGFKVFGMDTMSPDLVGEDGMDSGEVHRLVLGCGGVIVENLNELESLLDIGPESGSGILKVSMLPLRLSGLDGSPIRAVAWWE